MEYRTVSTIPGLSLADESRWKRLIGRLEQSPEDELGPILSFDHGTAEITLGMDVAHPEIAVIQSVETITEALRDANLDSLYVGRVEVAPADGEMRHRTGSAPTRA